MQIVVQRYQEGIRYHLRNVASQMVKSKMITDEPRGKGSQSSKSGQIVPVRKTEASSAAAAAEAPAGGHAACVGAAAAAAEAPAGGHAACVGASTKAAKVGQTEASKAKESHREQKGRASKASSSATQNPKGRGKGKQSQADEGGKGGGKQGCYTAKGKDPQPPWREPSSSAWQEWGSSGSWSGYWSTPTSWWEPD